jgi:hypothetical protein
MFSPIAVGLWQNSTSWWEHMKKRSVHFMTARKQRKRGIKGLRSHNPFKAMPPIP